MFVSDLTVIGVTSQSVAFVVLSAAFSGNGINFFFFKPCKMMMMMMMVVEVVVVMVVVVVSPSPLLNITTKSTSQYSPRKGLP